jgi:hypothetical protein
MDRSTIDQIQMNMVQGYNVLALIDSSANIMLLVHQLIDHQLKQHKDFSDVIAIQPWAYYHVVVAYNTAKHKLVACLLELPNIPVSSIDVESLNAQIVIDEDCYNSDLNQNALKAWIEIQNARIDLLDMAPRC